MAGQAGRVTGLGGVFITSPDPDALRAWYAEVLGIAVSEWGAEFPFPESGAGGYTVWSPFRDDTPYFIPSTRDVMINFRVEGLEALLARAKAKGAVQIGDVKDEGYGKFAWLLDPDGTKIELWEQTDG